MAMIFHEITILFFHSLIVLTYDFRFTATQKIAEFVIGAHSPRSIFFNSEFLSSYIYIYIYISKEGELE